MRERKRGFTLMELILAMTILSIVLVAASSLAVSGLRFTKSNTSDIHWQNELQYILRDMERHLRAGKDPQIERCDTSDPNEGPVCAMSVGTLSGDSITYRYNPVVGQQTLTREMRPLADGQTDPILSRGKLVPRPITVDTNSIPETKCTPADTPPTTCEMFEIVDGSKDKLIAVHLAFDGDESGEMQISRSFLLRGDEG